MTRLTIIREQITVTVEDDRTPTDREPIDVEGEDVTERSGVHRALRPLAKAVRGAEVVPLFRKVSA
jgi:hypothetical protein